MIQLKFTHLLYDIEQQTHALATARFNENPDVKNEAQIDQSEHLSDIAMRYCEEGCALLNTLLKDKLVPDNSHVEQPQTDALTYDTKTWDFNTNITSPDEHTLATLFHRFVIAYALWQWAKLYSPAEASALNAQMLDVQKEIENVIYNLGTPTKHRPCTCANPDAPHCCQPEITFEP